ncbi:hypothetical protein [Maritalea sp.]|uniref:hypothetical protein n=1 Tax=Maritalea sp. TaxID=2003361 RepID=UPI003EF88A4D
MAGEKQAVVVVHGMGEQRPMGMMRRIVETLWTTDEAMLAPGDRNIGPDGNKSWIVPDCKTGSHDLQRITTPAAKDGKRTDFFEFYYADILDDAKLRNLWRWLWRIVTVRPAFVVDRMVWPWSALCFLIVLVGLVASGVMLLGVGTVFDLLWWNVDGGTGRFSVWETGFIGFLNVGLMVGVGRLIPKLRWILRWPSYALLAVLVYYILFSIGGVEVRSVLVGGTVLISLLTSLYFLPYLGDVAGYLGAHPDTVKKRHDVRERGLSLLRDLNADPTYDRIVIVAHSLGSVVAYDILHLLWEELGPTNENPPGEKVRQALYEHDLFVRNHQSRYWNVLTVQAYQKVQARVAEAIRLTGPVNNKLGEETQSYWKITDFVSFGSPLSHAQFLLARGVENFEKLKEERLFPVVPPRPYNEDFGALYTPDKLEFSPDYAGMPIPQTTAEWALKAPRAYAHHGTVFSCVRWTNMFDEHNPLFFWQGDVLGGPVGGFELFGRGVLEHKVHISYSKYGVDDLRLATHTRYWTNTAQSGIADHIVKFRNAVGLLKSKD